MMSKDYYSDFFVAGGTLRADAPSYVQRPSDNQLLQLSQSGQFCYVLTSRQMGKSSLMVRTARRLRTAGVRPVIIDLAQMGTDTQIEQWYLGLITRLWEQLQLITADPEQWWHDNAALNPVQRFTTFLRQVVLAEITDPIVIFVDEIDATLRLDFADDFFAAIRATYNARASDAAYQRLTFVLLGVATPASLIQDRRRTPFNIGQRIALLPFDRGEAGVLAEGLQQVYGEGGTAVFNRIFHWTNGHPYLTQKLCLSVAESGQRDWDDGAVDGLVQRQFLSDVARRETNLQFVQNSVNAFPQKRALLHLYQKIYMGKQVEEDERSLVQNQLKLMGLARANGRQLTLPNEIYRHVFNEQWLAAHMPADWSRRIAVMAALMIVLLLGSFGYLRWRQLQTADLLLAQTTIETFAASRNATLRLNSLAQLFEMAGWQAEARRLFAALPEVEKLPLFGETTADLRQQLRLVTQNVYIMLDNTEANNALLAAMRASLSQFEDTESRLLASEIGQWLNGRAAQATNDIEAAHTAYQSALDLNSSNPAVHFDLALLLAQQAAYEATLAHLDTALSLPMPDDVQAYWHSRTQALMLADAALMTAWELSAEQYPALEDIAVEK